MRVYFCVWTIWVLYDIMYIELLKFEGIYIYICIDCLDLTWFFTYVVGLLCFGTVFFLQHAKCVRVEL